MSLQAEGPHIRLEGPDEDLAIIAAAAALFEIRREADTRDAGLVPFEGPAEGRIRLEGSRSVGKHAI